MLSLNKYQIESLTVTVEAYLANYSYRSITFEVISIFIKCSGFVALFQTHLILGYNLKDLRFIMGSITFKEQTSSTSYENDRVFVLSAFNGSSDEDKPDAHDDTSECESLENEGSHKPKMKYPSFTKSPRNLICLQSWSWGQGEVYNRKWQRSFRVTCCLLLWKNATQLNEVCRHANQYHSDPIKIQISPSWINCYKLVNCKT